MHRDGACLKYSSRNLQICLFQFVLHPDSQVFFPQALQWRPQESFVQSLKNVPTSIQDFLRDSGGTI